MAPLAEDATFATVLQCNKIQIKVKKKISVTAKLLQLGSVFAEVIFHLIWYSIHDLLAPVIGSQGYTEYSIMDVPPYAGDALHTCKYATHKYPTLNSRGNKM